MNLLSSSISSPTSISPMTTSPVVLGLAKTLSSFGKLKLVLLLELALPGRFPELETDPRRELESVSIDGDCDVVGDSGLLGDLFPSKEKPGMSGIKDYT